MRKAIVMAGGQGSRLRPLTSARPKPLVKVANQPVLVHILNWLAKHGFTEVLLTLHYRAEDIARTLGDGLLSGLSLTYQVEEAPLGTAGSVKLAENWIGDEPFLIASGDALTDLNLSLLITRHRESTARMTLALRQVQDPSQYGVVVTNERGRVIRFQEKPQPDDAVSDLANTGIYCVEPSVLRQIPGGRAYDWSREVFPQLLAEQGSLYGFVLNGYWCDIGSLGAYRQGQRDALLGAVDLRMPGQMLGPDVRAGRNSQISPAAYVKGPVLLGESCRIERGARVFPDSVIGDGTVIGAGACVAGAVLGSRCRIGRGAVIHDCVLDDDVSVGMQSVVSEGVVLGRGCRVVDGAAVSDGQRFEPATVVGAPSPVPSAVPCDIPVGTRRRRRSPRLQPSAVPAS
jgi:mannose-1-phosphate guanylyltransferase/phosphomannomutase